MNQKTIEAVIVGFALFHACIVALSSLYSMWAYRGAPRYRHVVSLAISHTILTLLVATGLIRYWNDQWWINNFRTPAALVAFGLSMFGLYQLIWPHSQENRHANRKR